MEGTSHMFCEEHTVLTALTTGIAMRDSAVERLDQWCPESTEKMKDRESQISSANQSCSERFHEAIDSARIQHMPPSWHPWL